MIRVMIVDDEPVILKGLTNVIRWDELDCKVVSTAINGIDGLAKFDKTSPELIITDIQMPKMNGLEMLRRIRELSKQVRFVVLTGYKEFEYAKEAIQHGVDDYILKPIDQEALQSLIKKICTDINQQKLNLERVDRNVNLIKNKIAYDLIFGVKKDWDGLYEYYGVVYSEQKESVLIQVTLDRKNISENELADGIMMDEVLDSFSKQLEELSEAYRFLCISCITHSTLFCHIRKIDNTQLRPAEVKEFCYRCSREIFNLYGLTSSTGISHIFKGVEDLNAARYETEQCIDISNYQGGNTIIAFNELSIEGCEEEREVNLQGYFDAISHGIGIGHELEKLCSDIRSIRERSSVKKIITRILLESYQIFSQKYFESSDVANEFSEWIGSILTAQSIHQLINILTESGLRLEERIASHNASKSGYILDRAIEYIHSHVHHEFTLEDVANHIYVSKWYFCKLFKKEMNQSFNEYVSYIKIEEAKRMLRDNPLLKNYEIAEMLGYKDVRYFGQLFKKTSGMSPSEYRG